MTAGRIDTFGNVQIGEGPAFRGRLIQSDATTFYLFPENGEAGQTLTFSAEPKKKGRLLQGTLTDESAFVFQRASCGCQTPTELRGPARKFIDTLIPANA
jgi:hypothetical protein